MTLQVNTYHVMNENIAPSEVTDNVGDERGDAFRASPSLVAWIFLEYFLRGALGIPKLRFLSLLILLISISHPNLENLNHTKLNQTS